VQGVFNQNQPGLQQLTDLTRNNVVNPLLDKFNASPGPANQASGYYSDVLNGKYLNGNPYMSNILQQLNRGVGDQVNSQFELSGRYGSGAHADVLSRNLADADSNVIYQNYGDEMNRMGQAAQGAQAGNTADTASLISAIGAGAQLPYTGSSNLASTRLGALFNGGTHRREAGAARLSGLRRQATRLRLTAVAAAKWLRLSTSPACSARSTGSIRRRG
jgi:hypothetical protein